MTDHATNDAAPITLRSPPQSGTRRKHGVWLDLNDDVTAPAIEAGEQVISNVTVTPEQRSLGEWLQTEVLIGSRRQYTPATPIKGVPPYPSFIKIPVVPAAPKLKASMSSYTVAATCAQAFGAAVEHVCGQPCWAFKGKNAPPLSQNKNFDLLVEAGRTLRDAQISPWAWCGWSCKIWQSMQQRGTVAPKAPPPARWVFGAQRLIERREEFCAVEHNYSGGALRMPEEFRRLLSDYLWMFKEINQGPGSSADIAAKWFPAWDDRVAAVQLACEAERIKIQQDISRGCWLW